jgi:oligopeptide transport system ATP-binding protein
LSALVEISGLVKHFPVRRGLLQRARGWVRAVDGIDLEVRSGECLAVVGESGSGKTTLGRLLMRLIEPTEGSIRFMGEDHLALSGSELRRRRRHFQMVFQDPYGSLDPRMTVGKTLREPLAAHRMISDSRYGARIGELLELVGLPVDAAARYPHEFSGGQRQRIGIARALATEPRLIVADEPVSALDVSVQAQIVNLLAGLQQRLGLTLVFIAHDLTVVEHLADRVAVLYLGKVVELAETAELFADPRHPYTVRLLDSIPVADPGQRRHRAATRLDPGPWGPELPPGCRYHPRCPGMQTVCQREEPVLGPDVSGREVACHFPGSVSPRYPAGPRRMVDEAEVEGG